MKVFKTIDLSPFCNHKLVYERLPDEGGEYGRDNICVLKEDFKFKERETIDGAEFAFSLSDFDNVVCDRQRIRIGERAERLHVIGFGYWGDIFEDFQLVYDDDSAAYLRVALPDWSHAGKGDVVSQFYLRDVDVRPARVVLSSGSQRHLIYFHYCTCEVDSQKPIREIVLPDNMFMHVFAISLEKNA